MKFNIWLILFLVVVSFFTFLNCEDIKIKISEHKIDNVYHNCNKHLGFGVEEKNDGVYVKEVFYNTAAYKAGLRKHDKILVINKKFISDIKDLNDLIYFSNENTPVEIVFKRKPYKSPLIIFIFPTMIASCK